MSKSQIVLEAIIIYVFFGFMIFGIPWVYYILTGSVINYG